ncbi:uncharacterized protein TNCV_1959801 [Trichonephila clavipes]|nr:uncharacterized protein TNCV_1959801 [Trichonephila clavipes]
MRQHPSSYRENNYHYQGGKFAQENHSGRNYNRRSHRNSYRCSREENLYYFDDKRDYSRGDGPYIVLSQRSPTTFVVTSCDKPLGVYQTSALTPFLNGSETQSPVVPLKKRGRPRKLPLIPRGTAGENSKMSASTLPHRDGLRQCLCQKCGYISSQAICKACVMLEGLNTGVPELGVKKSSKVKDKIEKLSVQCNGGGCNSNCIS